MSAKILTPNSSYIAPTASLKPQGVPIGQASRQQEEPRETPESEVHISTVRRLS
jgi:hypothetical protein